MRPSLLPTGLLGIFAMLLAACQPAPDQGWRERLEPVPAVSLARREAGDVARLTALRQRVEQTIAQPELSAADAARAYSELGRQYMAHEFDRAALAAFANVVAIDPDWRTAHYLRAVLLQHQGQLEAARAHLLESLRIDPKDGNTLLRLGDVALAGGDATLARHYFELAMAIPSTTLSAKAGLGRTAFFTRDYEQAIAALTAVLKDRPQASALRHPLAQSLREIGELSRAKAELAMAGTEPLTQADPMVDALAELMVGSRSLLSRAHAAKTAGQFEAAERLYRDSIAADPESALAAAGLGQMLAELERYEESLAAYQQAIEIDPDFPQAWFNIATAQLKLGNPGAAETAFGRVLKIDPEHLEARFRLAGILHAKGDVQAAHGELEMILSKDPTHLKTLQSLVMLELEEGRLDQAKARLTDAQALTMEPAEQSALLLLEAYIASTGGDNGAARGAYQRALNLDPGNFEAAFNLGAIEFSGGLHAAAQQSLSRAVQLQPEHTKARLALARAQIALGQWQAARDTLNQGDLAYRANNETLMTLIELLAASPDASVRDGERALHLAEQATRETRNLRFMELTAMAAAELGEFEQAAALMQRLVDTAQQQSAPAEVQRRLTEALASYRSQRPSRLGTR